MSKMAIILPGQVYLSEDHNEYLVVLKSVKGDIVYKGIGFGGRHDWELFMERFKPVNPVDLTEDEAKTLKSFLDEGTELSIGWVQWENEEEEFVDD